MKGIGVLMVRSLNRKTGPEMLMKKSSDGKLSIPFTILKNGEDEISAAIRAIYECSGIDVGLLSYFIYERGHKKIKTSDGKILDSILYLIYADKNAKIKNRKCKWVLMTDKQKNDYGIQ